MTKTVAPLGHEYSFMQHWQWTLTINLLVTPLLPAFPFSPLKKDQHQADLPLKDQNEIDAATL